VTDRRCRRQPGTLSTIRFGSGLVIVAMLLAASAALGALSGANVTN
jgi:hypothetical protein